jgi:hypothetical protein
VAPTNLQVDCFRSKAVQLIRSEGLVRADSSALKGSGFKVGDEEGSGAVPPRAGRAIDRYTGLGVHVGW